MMSQNEEFILMLMLEKTETTIFGHVGGAISSQLDKTKGRTMNEMSQQDPNRSPSSPKVKYQTLIQKEKQHEMWFTIFFYPI